MQVKLKKLILQNFKGVSNYTLEPQGQNMVVRGVNGTGKTTLFDAFLWLMFSKDSHGKSDFEIKTLDDNNQLYNGLEHSVRVVLMIGDQEKELKKVFREVWKKQKGSTNKVFSGHETRYEVDGNPVKKKKDWEKELESIIYPETFRMLTDPAYFATLRWDTKRNILLNMVNVDEEEVFQEDPSLEGLRETLSNTTASNFKQQCLDNMKSINERLQNIPPRIDELTNQLEDVQDDSKEDLEQRLKQAQDELRKLQKSGTDPKLQEQLASWQTEYKKLSNSRQVEYDNKKQEYRNAIDKAQDQISEAKGKLSELTTRRDTLKKEIEALEKDIKDLRQQYHDLDKTVQVDDTCPTCGQKIPEDQVTELETKQIQEKAERQRKIQEQGKAKRQAYDNKVAELQQREHEIEAQTEHLTALEQHLQQLQTERNNLQVAEPFQEEIEASNKVQELQQQMDNLEAPDTTEVENRLNDLQSRLVKLQSAERTQERIEELKQEEKDLAQKYESWNLALQNVRDYIYSQAQLYEDKVNELFNDVRIKLFDQQVDGTIVENCEVLYKGVPFGSLNTGGRINAGLDIINAFSIHYGITAPIFVDHAESVTITSEVQSQLIKLVFDENIEKLTAKEG